MVTLAVMLARIAWVHARSTPLFLGTVTATANYLSTTVWYMGRACVSCICLRAGMAGGSHSALHVSANSSFTWVEQLGGTA
jgi:hypothetical protein